ncbi:MAG TPA: hypothetical protein VHM91_09295 [Verrucomicrobiales bacterium]|nr:hypothetical protein [Verrucomicrobiales bacterium]
MKSNIPAFIRTASLAVVFALPAMAQQIVKETVEESTGGDTETTTTTTSGTINEFGENRIVIHTETSEDPVTYSFSKSTTYVDEAGAPVSIETVKSGLPVTIQYEKADTGLVAKKVIVRKRTQTTPGQITETKTTTTTGTINEFGDNALVIRTESSREPVRYRYTKTTKYVDESGNPVSMKIVKSGLPVTVYYTKDGDGMVASKVVVKKVTGTAPATRTETTKTTTTSSMGTVSEIADNRLLIRTETNTEPVAYSFTKTTTYVDEAGEPVTIDVVKSGLPVTVYYTRDGDALVASKVVVRKKTTTVVPR